MHKYQFGLQLLMYINQEKKHTVVNAGGQKSHTVENVPV